jgi:hypothetical protein
MYYEIPEIVPIVFKLPETALDYQGLSFLKIGLLDLL